MKKFPQYEALGSNIEKNDNTWIGVKCRYQGALKKPSDEFFGQLQKMEKIFQSYHGPGKLKGEKNSVRNLSEIIKKVVTPILPEDVIKYFVRCRLFFRMRILNRKAQEPRKVKRKLSKLTSSNSSTAKKQEKTKLLKVVDPNCKKPKEPRTNKRKLSKVAEPNSKLRRIELVTRNEGASKISSHAHPSFEEPVKEDHKAGHKVTE